MSKQPNMIVQGKVVNPSVIAAFAKRLNSIEEIVSVWANASILQVVQHGNRNWLDSMFKSTALTYKNGRPNKMGEQVIRYIKAHYPAFAYDKENNTVGVTKPTGKSILLTHFVAVGATSPTGDMAQQRDKFYTPHGDFHLTFREFLDLESVGAEEKDEDPQVAAKAFLKQISKAHECLKVERFIGTPEEIAAALAEAQAFIATLEAAQKQAAEFKANKAKGVIIAPGTVEDSDDTVEAVDTLALLAQQTGNSEFANGGESTREVANA